MPKEKRKTLIISGDWQRMTFIPLTAEERARIEDGSFRKNMSVVDWGESQRGTMFEGFVADLNGYWHDADQHTPVVLPKIERPWTAIPTVVLPARCFLIFRQDAQKDVFAQVGDDEFDPALLDIKWQAIQHGRNAEPELVYEFSHPKIKFEDDYEDWFESFSLSDPNSSNLGIEVDEDDDGFTLSIER
jgi:hypothetical protein